MTSERKTASNRINGRKSRGPRTAAGKSRASRNAFRHGLSTISRNNPAFAREIEVYARAVCGDDTDPLLFDQANIIAECQMVFRCLRAERVGLIERLQDPTAIPIVKGDNARALAKARSEQSRLAFDEYMRLLDNLYGALPQEHRHRNYDDLMQHLYLHCPDKLMEEYHGPKWPVADEPPQERDEFTALRMAMPDLDRLIPYQRRAKSRLKRALDNFTRIKSQRCPPKGEVA